MSQQTQGQLLTDEQRTVIFSKDEVKAIYTMISGHQPDEITEAIEEVFQQLLYHNEELDNEIHIQYFRLREVRSFYTNLYKRLYPIYEAIEKLPFDVRIDNL